MGGYCSLFKGRRLWYRMAVAMIVIVVMRYALGWFSEIPRQQPSAIRGSITEDPSGGAFLVRKADMALLARRAGERTWMTKRKE